MILVADSGSSKTDWILNLTKTDIAEFSTVGVNPYFDTEKEICKRLSASPDIQKYNSRIKEVYFFGEGCTNPDKREMVSNALSKVFSKAFISVENDSLGSAYATCGKTMGFTCILGTSSNMGFFDGAEVQNKTHDLGFVLADEGSGAWLGKRLITSFLYGKMPRELASAFRAEYKLDKDEVILNVYQRTAPNFYLASFAPFLSKFREHTFIRQMLVEGFEEFISVQTRLFPFHKDFPFHFVGSIAYHFRDVLEDVCRQRRIRMGKVLAHHIRELSAFIMKNAG
jgi:glucosamine kinase